MAHECPDCSLTCHCGGDIDDIVFHDTIYESRCRCCEAKDGEPYDFDDDYDDLRGILGDALNSTRETGGAQ